MTDAARGEPVAFRCRRIGSKFDWTYIDHRAPDSFELRECEIQSLYAHPLPAPAPAGWRLAPVEPTLGMAQAWEANGASRFSRFSYLAALAAAPSAPPTDSVSSGTALGRARASQCQSEVAERLQRRLEQYVAVIPGGGFMWKGKFSFEDVLAAMHVAADAIAALRGETL